MYVYLAPDIPHLRNTMSIASIVPRSVIDLDAGIIFFFHGRVLVRAVSQSQSSSSAAHGCTATLINLTSRSLVLPNIHPASTLRWMVRTVAYHIRCFNIASQPRRTFLTLPLLCADMERSRFSIDDAWQLSSPSVADLSRPIDPSTAVSSRSKKSYGTTTCVSMRLRTSDDR